jgi:hypothetical protein
MANNDRGSVCAPFNFSWVVQDELAAMGYPKMPSNLRFLEKEGVRFLVTLSPEKRPPIHTCPNLNWSEIPIQEFCSPSVSQIKAFIDICQKSKTKKEVRIYAVLCGFDINFNRGSSNYFVNHCCNRREHV